MRVRLPQGSPKRESGRPAPTRALEQGLQDIREHGLAIIPDMLTGDVR